MVQALYGIGELSVNDACYGVNVQRDRVTRHVAASSPVVRTLGTTLIRW